MSSGQQKRVERRLAAIMAADIAGYSRLMGEDEEGTLAALKAIRRELAEPKIAENRGRIVKTTGDGLLVEFPSVVDAVRCAVEVQREMALRNTAAPQARRIEYRIGINLGDVIIDEHDIYGTASMSPPASKPWRIRAAFASAGSCATRYATSSISLSRIWAISRSRILQGRFGFIAFRSPISSLQRRLCLCPTSRHSRCGRP